MHIQPLKCDPPSARGRKNNGSACLLVFNLTKDSRVIVQALIPPYPVSLASSWPAGLPPINEYICTSDGYSHAT